MPDKAKLYEVMVDTWGADPQFTKGDLIKPGDCPYDLDTAERMGTIRPAPEYVGSGISSTSLPLNADGSVDWETVDRGRAAAGMASPEAQHQAAKDDIAALEGALESAKLRLKQTEQAAEAEVVRRGPGRPPKVEPAVVAVQRPVIEAQRPR